MRLKKFGDFNVKSTPINEDIKQAKAFLRKRIKTEGDKPSDEEIFAAENDPNFLKIKKMLDKHPGYVYSFTKFFFADNVPLNELETAYKRLQSYKNSKNIKPITEYAKVVPDDLDPRSGFERMTDDLDNADTDKVVAEFVAQFPGAFVVKVGANQGREVPSIKDEYRKASQTIKDKVKGIALAFETVCTDEDGNVDVKACMSNKLVFYKSTKRYQSLNELLNAANANLKSANNLGVSKMIKSISMVNDKYGEINGAEIVFNENEILVVEIRSFQANRLLNANTKHCIKDTISYWNSYIGGDDMYTKQYYIYNFNLLPSENNSVIGVTIDKKHDIYAAHAKDDGDVKSSLKRLLTSFKSTYDLSGDIYNEVLIPMTESEIEMKRRRVVANRELVKPNLTIGQLTQYIKDGGDPNVNNGTPLVNAIKANEIEIAQELITNLGAITDIGSASEYPIKYSTSFDMIKMLVEHDATISSALINQENILGDPEIMKFLLENGANPNDGKGLSIRNAAKKGYAKTIALLIEYGGNLDSRAGLTVNVTLEHADPECSRIVVDYLADHKMLSAEKMEKTMKWLTRSSKIKKEDKLMIFTMIKDKCVEVGEEHEYIDEALSTLE